MKHWKRILAAALSVILLCGVCFAVSGISAPRANAANGETVAPQSEPSFTDVSAEAWYAEAVGWCRENGIMSGTSDTTFAPEASMTRAMMVTVLHRAAGTPASTEKNVFTDNVPGSWSYEAVVWAAANNILAEYGDGRFGSNDPVTREQAAVILHRYAGNPDAGTTVTAADASAISSYAVNAVTWASATGIRVNGAALILLPDILEKIGEKAGMDYYLIPSSIHELLIARDDGLVTPKMLKELVYEGNRTDAVIKEEDVLSDNIYFYSRAKKSLKIA